MNFSCALGAGARQAKGSFLVVTFGATVTSAIAGLLFTFLMLRHIRQTEERYEHLLDTANDAILVLDAETRLIVQANRQSSKLLGRPLREIGGIRGEESLFWSVTAQNMTEFWTARSEEQPSQAKSHA